MSEQKEPLPAYGYCPKCGAEGLTRERRPNGDDTCLKGHTYPSNQARYTPVAQPDKADKRCDNCNNFPTLWCSECNRGKWSQPDKAEVVERMAGAFYNVIPPESHTDSHNWHTYCHTLAEIALQYLPAEALPPQRDDSGLREIEQYLTSGLDDVEIANLTQHDKHILELARNGQKSPQHDDSLVESMQRWIDHPTKALTS